jgi:flagellar motor switch protein FliM
MAVKPFNFGGLKKVSEASIQLIDLALEMLPETEARDKLGTEIRKIFLKHFGEKSFYYLDSVVSDSYGSIVASLPDNPIIAVLNLEPKEAKAIFTIDNNLVFLLIDRLLGGTGEPSVEKRPLSETEQGVLQYFIMQILASIWRSFGESARLHYRFERFIFDPRDAAPIINAKETAVSFVFKAGIGELSGFVKITFSVSFLNKIASTSSESVSERAHFLERLDRFGFLRTSVWAECGKATISSSDLIALENGDVIVFDETGLTEAKPAGSVDLKVGGGESGSLRADVSSTGKVIKCTIVGG